MEETAATKTNVKIAFWQLMYPENYLLLCFSFLNVRVVMFYVFLMQEQVSMFNDTETVIPVTKQN